MVRQEVTPNALWSAGTYEQWGSFRRPASIDCSRSLGSSRRRGSIELSMPWRSKLDAVIAQVAADDQAAPAGTAAVQSTDGRSSNTGVAAVGAATRSQSQVRQIHVLIWICRMLFPMWVLQCNPLAFMLAN